MQHGYATLLKCTTLNRGPFKNYVLQLRGGGYTVQHCYATLLKCSTFKKRPFTNYLMQNAVKSRNTVLKMCNTVTQHGFKKQFVKISQFNLKYFAKNANFRFILHILAYYSDS